MAGVSAVWHSGDCIQYAWPASLLIPCAIPLCNSLFNKGLMLLGVSSGRHCICVVVCVQLGRFGVLGTGSISYVRAWLMNLLALTIKCVRAFVHTGETVHGVWHDGRTHQALQPPYPLTQG
jgi:hypothetical protein